MFLKVFSVILVSMIKTFFAPAMGFAAGFSFGTTFAITACGAMGGFVVSYFFCDFIMKTLIRRKKTKITAQQLKKARKIVTFKRNHPVWLFVPSLPLVSIPIMALIVRKYFKNNKPVFALSLLTVTFFALAGCFAFSPIQYL